MNRAQGLITIIALSVVLLLPFLGFTLYSTKGEPREATVAQAMLAQDNYALPLTYGEDMPYKPPMLAWCICAAAQLNGGEVNEYTSRLPSALAAIILTAMTYMWLTRRRRGSRMTSSGSDGGQYTRAVVTSLLMLTAFEVLRAATACRVDMLLTMFMVGSIYLLDNEGVTRYRPLRYILAILMMSGEVMTKGPVGAFLPCLIAGVYRLWVGRPLWRTLGIMIGVGVASMMLPALWYWTAWSRGGEAFWALVMEENVGRITGTMSYESHVNPWWYNITSLLGGICPYTLLALLAAIGWRRITARQLPQPRELGQMAWVAAVVIFVFYCIPASKRSVYLLPMYPFVAYGVMMLCRRTSQWAVSAFAYTIYIIALAVPCVLVTLSQIDVLKGVPDIPLSIAGWMLVTLPALMALALMIHRSGATVGKAVAVVYALYIAFLGAIQPAILNPRSNMPQAQAIARVQPQGEVYGYGADKLHNYYSLDYYLGGRMRRLPPADSVRHEVLSVVSEGREASVKALGWRLQRTTLRFASADYRRDTLRLCRLTPQRP